MIVKISKTFDKDISRIKNKNLKQAVFDIIKLTQQAPNLHEIPQLKKLKGHKDFFRIRLGRWHSHYQRNSRIFNT